MLKQKRPIKIAALLALISLSLFAGLSIYETALASNGSAYDSKGKRDPFTPLIGEAYVLSEAEDLDISELILEGVIYHPSHDSYVLINGKTLQEGHIIGGFTIVRIIEDGVILEKEGGQHTLRMKTQEIPWE